MAPNMAASAGKAAAARRALPPPPGPGPRARRMAPQDSTSSSASNQDPGTPRQRQSDAEAGTSGNGSRGFTAADSSSALRTLELVSPTASTTRAFAVGRARDSTVPSTCHPGNLESRSTASREFEGSGQLDEFKDACPGCSCGRSAAADVGLAEARLSTSREATCTAWSFARLRASKKETIMAAFLPRILSTTRAGAPRWSTCATVPVRPGEGFICDVPHLPGSCSPRAPSG